MDDRCFHVVQDRPYFLHNSWVIPHCLGPDDDTCWCEPDVFIYCPHCEHCPGDDDFDPEEVWKEYCNHCGNSGLIPLDEAGDIAPDEPLLIQHKDR